MRQRANGVHERWKPHTCSMGEYVIRCHNELRAFSIIGIKESAIRKA